MAKTDDNDVFVVKDDGYIYYLESGKQAFRKLNTKRLVFESVQYVCVDSSHTLWIFSSNGDVRSYAIKKTKADLQLVEKRLFHPQGSLIQVSGDRDQVYLIDHTYALYEYDLLTQNKYHIADLEEEIAKRGSVSSIVKQRDNYFIGFKHSGVICLKYLPDQKSKYGVHSIGVEAGVFCLMKDRFQDIIWIGTDGKGLIMCFPDRFSIHSTLLDTPTFQINSPVRAMFLDDKQTLWLGTKGDGILRLLHYTPGSTQVQEIDRLESTNSTLSDNSVYCFSPSRWNRLWIGTERGLNYFSYKENKMKEFLVTAGGKLVRYVHSICELNDSTLWVATVGEGVIKISLNISGKEPRISSTKRFVVDNGRRASNYFFVSYCENDSIIWLGNRGYGAYKLNTNEETLTPFRFDKTISNQTVNDVFSILVDEKGCWFGTSFGLTRMTSANNYHVFNEADGFPNNTIHSILKDRSQNLWLSTNQGVVMFNTVTNTVAYNRQNNMDVTEFSDGAFFKDALTGTLFFGGTNGFITIEENDFDPVEFTPRLYYNRLSIFGKECNIYDFLKEDKGKKVIELDYSRNFFNLSFVVLDYINGPNYTYSYQIEGLSDQWIENGFSSTAVFSNLSPGEYTLLVKWRSNITGEESNPQALTIRINPPWYMTQLAYFIYSLVIISLMMGCIYLIIRYYRRKRDAIIEKMNRQQRDELYESKLRFFTNITHEFCTPLTLISGPCEKVLSYSGADGFVRKYTEMIQHNARKLNDLIVELIEFRRLETGHKVLNIQEVAVGKQTLSTAQSFSVWAESRAIDYQLNVDESIHWNTDSSCLSKIVNNLISNAFKYTPDNGTIGVDLSIADEQLFLRVSNTGKGIKEADLTRVFDRYKILDNFEVQHKNGISPRNGLGLAICHSMVHQLNGEIIVSSTPNEITTFEVRLPEITVSGDTHPDRSEVLTSAATLPEEQSLPITIVPEKLDKSRQTILVIDDDPSMLWFVSEIFTGAYNVISLSSAEEALKLLSVQLPHLIISDVMMPGMDGMSFATTLKADKLLGRIPLILLSALNNIEEQAKGIESGAEAYITKPFNVNYLEKVVERLLQRDEELKEYYSSVLSAFELNDGHFLHKEDKSFFDAMMKKIDDHIDDADLSVETLSSAMGYSTRQFYRKLKVITDNTPAEIIREYRLTIVERLLLTTQLTVEEIMDKTGFSNRGTFYKVFSQKFGIPPRQYKEEKRKDAIETDR